ncbi:MAG: hypothetical protein N3D74_00795 [Caldisericia bacterium]|nr:hypothetical protein [Caldisericia bacterium]
MSKLTLRKIYLYLFSLVGLTLIIIGTVGFINLGLQLTLFKEALEYKYGVYQPPYPYWLEGIKLNETIEKIELTDEQKKALLQWQTEFERYQEKAKSMGYLPYVADSFTRNLAMLIVGIPVYLYHWGLIKKEHKEENS